MEVYIEYVVADNLIINTLILVLTKKTLNLQTRVANLVAAALLGTVFAIFMPLFMLNEYLLFFIKMLLGVAIILVAFPTKKPKKILVNYLWFLTYTFALGGMCFGVAYLLGQNLSLNGLIVMGFEVPMGIFMLIIAIYIYLLVKTVSLVKKGVSKVQNTYSVIIKNGKQFLHAEGFLDSGNRLYHNGQPVVVISPKLFKKLFSCPPPDTLENGTFLNKPHYIEANTVTNAQKLLVFTLTEINILTADQLIKHKNLQVGVAQNNFSTQFDCLLHQDLF